ncbi:manganese ion transporter [Scheffersomyces xylosifermentans]|uniref:manganese ion transporter n=1 Tax=Scheffersomyces xylosifermentans TaxID=1304137 RepID=UPI00315D2291
MSIRTVLTSITQSYHIKKLVSVLKTYSRFIGPGLMVSVAYMDPGNYSTAVAAGSAYKYNLLFSILLSNCLAIFLQILAAKLGAVTGLDLAANCKANFSFKTNLFIYILAEIAIIATDLAEVVGTAISLNILFKLPLFAGVILTVVDVLIVLMAYRPKGPLLFIRIFESFVSILVAATVVCFAIELYQVSHDPEINFSVGEVMRGFLPNEKVIDSSDRKGGNGLFLSLAILGATVMPHSLYLGSGLVQARLKDFDIKHGFYKPFGLTSKPAPTDEDSLQPLESSTSDTENNITPLATPYDGDLNINNPRHRFEKDNDSASVDEDENDHYRPSIHAINDTMSYTIVELVISLFTVALFVNAAILIVAGATLNTGYSNNPEGGSSRMLHHDDDHHDDDHKGDESDSEDNYQNADLFTIYHLLSKHLSPTAGFVFALALLCSGQSAGVVCTLAGQMVSEGFLDWSLPPVTRRLITRGLAIAPCLFVVSFSGREGLAKILNTSQVVLSVLLPVVTAPLILFTCSKEIMKVPIFVRDGDEDVDIVFEQEDGTSRTFDDDEVTLPAGNASTSSTINKPKRFQSTEPAIRLQDLRKSHPCAGWEEDDDEEGHFNHGTEEQQHLLEDGQTTTPYPRRLSAVAASHGININPVSPSSVPMSSTPGSGPANISQYLPQEIFEDVDHELFRIKGYKDFSNSPMMAFIAILIWGFITCLNLYLIGSMLLGYDVPL